MTGKARALFLLRYLRDHTDEGKAVTANEIMEAFKEAGEKISRPTLREDIASLQEAGFEIIVREVPGTATYYKFTDREWSLPELQILIDAVSSGMFISRKRSAEMIQKLKDMAGPTERDQLMPSIEVEDQVKAPNDDILYIIQDIKVAILNDEKISFRYYEYDPELKQVPKHNGYVYVVSPYAMIWKKDRYYLVGWSEKHRDVAHFRIDRIGKLSLTGKARHPAPEDLHLGDRSSKVFSMFDGPEEVVTLRLRPRLIGQVIDQFGEKLEISKKRENRMDVTVTVHLSPTFYAWLFQYTGEMTVIAPEHVREAYAGYLQDALDDALGE